MPVYILALFLLVFSFHSHSASLSTYRIYLDNQKREQSFVVFNKTNVEEVCELYLRHYEHDLHGEMTEIKGDTIPDFSVKPHLRFTPKKFVLAANSSQSVKFRMKRKRGAKGEFTSYLAVKCRSKRVAKGSGVNVTPQIIMNVPIVVRAGELTVDLNVQSLKIENNKLSGELVRSGDRSVYGDIIVFDKNSKEVIAHRRNMSIYVSQQFQKFELILPKQTKVNDLMLQFIESGEALISQPIVN